MKGAPFISGVHGKSDTGLLSRADKPCVASTFPSSVPFLNSCSPLELLEQFNHVLMFHLRADIADEISWLFISAKPVFELIKIFGKGSDGPCSSYAKSSKVYASLGLKHFTNLVLIHGLSFNFKPYVLKVVPEASRNINLDFTRARDGKEVLNLFAGYSDRDLIASVIAIK